MMFCTGQCISWKPSESRLGLDSSYLQHLLRIYINKTLKKKEKKETGKKVA